MKFSSKIWASVVIVAFLVPNIYVIVKGKESFPFTQAPMFGHYIGPNTLFYNFSFTAQNGEEEKLVYPSMKRIEKTAYFPTMRLFFKYYGSTELNSPFSYYENDTREAFEKRMSAYFKAYFGYLKKDSSGFKKIAVDVSQYDRKYTLKEKHAIGYYDIATENFISTWLRNQ